jgi:hypothetical protein
MVFAFYSPSFGFWRNAIGIAALIVCFPLILLLKLVSMPFERPAERSPAEVAAYLRDFLNGGGGEWDWDDFTSIPIANPELEDIRGQAAMLELPLTADGRAQLEKLIERANASANLSTSASSRVR